MVAFKYRIYQKKEQGSLSDKDKMSNGRAFKYENCSPELNKDINVSKNILRIGLGTIVKVEINACEDEDTTSKSIEVSHVCEAGRKESVSNCRIRRYR